MKKFLILVLALACLFLASCSRAVTENNSCATSVNSEDSIAGVSKETQNTVNIDGEVANNQSTENQPQGEENNRKAESGNMETVNEFILTGIVKANNDRLEIEVINSDYAFGLYWVLTHSETEFMSKNGDTATKNDICVGDTVEISYGGQTMLSYPPQIVASRVKIIEN